MGELGQQLKFHRERLNDYLFSGNKKVNADTDYVQVSFQTLEPLLDNWWNAYKEWEFHDTFNKAMQQKRMTVRTFPGILGVPENDKSVHPKVHSTWGETGFKKQVAKEFLRGELSVVNTNKNVSTGEDEVDVRIFADSKYTPLASEVEAKRHDEVFHKTEEKLYYGARRGIDSSNFANPLNFVTRERKYEEGLHDLSASLVNPELSIFGQVHNNNWDAHFSFLPLSKEEDQMMLFNLTRIAKALKSDVVGFYNKVRYYRAAMTRVKLANEFDMAIGYSAVPVATVHVGEPAYKLRYGLTKNTTIIGPNGQQTVAVTAQLYRERQMAALQFKSIVGKRDAKNEIVIAIRSHEGPFPVYAIRQKGQLVCYDIVGKTMKFNGKTITASGVMSA